jgi:hypothetical protein
LTIGPISIFGCIVLFLSCWLVTKVSRGLESILTQGLIGEQGSKKAQRKTGETC